jgi:hypothetical protein
MPGDRVFLCPKTGAAGINRHSWMHVRLSPFDIDTGLAEPVPVTGAFTDFQEQSYPSAQQWGNRGYILANDRTEGQLASTTTPGVANKIDGSAGITLTGPAAGDWVIDVGLNAHNYVAFTGGSKGDATVRLIVAFQGERIATMTGANTYTGSGAIVSSGTVDLTELLRERIQPRRWYMTVAEVEAALEQLEVLVVAFVGRNAHRVTTWYAGPVDIDINYWDVEPEYQSYYQFQVDDVDGLFTPPSWDSDNVGAGDENKTHYFLPAEAHAAVNADAHPTRRWLRFKEWNQWGNPGNWIGPVSYDLMSDRMSELAINPRNRPITLVEIEAVIFFEAHLWNRHEYDAANLYKIDLDRRLFPISEWQVIDIEIEGVRQKATRQNLIDDVEDNANSFIHDEWGAGQAGQTQPAHVLYYRPSSVLHPGGMDAFRSLGVGVVVRVGFANQAVVTGETEDVPYLPIVLKSPNINDSVTGFSEGRGATPSGDLILANVRVQGYDPASPLDVADVDIWTTPEWASNAPLWNRLAALVNPLGPRPVGMQFHRRPLVIKLLPPGAPYGDALEVFRGEVGLNGAKLANDRISLKTYGWQIQAKEAYFSRREITLTEYPNAPEKSVGRNYQQAWGTGHTRAEALVVDDTAAALLTTGDNWSAVTAFYMDGEVYPESYSFTAATQEIKLTGPSAATHIAEFHTFEFDGSGEAIEQWDVSVTAATRAGALMRRFIRELGVLDADVLVDYFKLLDNPAAVNEWPLALIQAQVRCIFPRKTPVLNGLRILEDTRAAHVRRRPDGKVDTVPMYPTELDEHSILVDRWDTAGALPFSIDTSRLAATEMIEYMGYADVYEPITEAPEPTYLTKGRWNVEGELRVATMFSAIAGVNARRHFEKLNEPYWRADMPILLKAANVWPGTPILAMLPSGPTPDGSIIWGLFKVEGVVGQTAEGSAVLACRYVKKAPLWMRPEDAVPSRYAF